MTDTAVTQRKQQILNRWTGDVLFECDVPDEVGIGFEVRYALEKATKEHTNLRDADLRGADTPVIENIHQKIYAAASVPGALDMGTWHCGTAHCRAGWAVTLAGAEGKALEDRMGTAGAAMAIYLKSDPDRWSKESTEHLPDFYCSNEEALADMKRLAEEEAARGVA